MFRTDLLDQPSILDEYSRVSAQHNKKYSWSMMCSEVLENRKFMSALQSIAFRNAEKNRFTCGTFCTISHTDAL